METAPSTPSAALVPVAAIHVASGTHEGANCPLLAGPTIVGSAAGADIVLHDEGVAPRHLLLRPLGHELLITAEATGVVVDNTPIGIGETVAATCPVDIRLADVLLRASLHGVAAAPVDAAEQRRRLPFRFASRRSRHVAAGAVVALLAAVPAMRAVSDVPAHAFEKPPSRLRGAVLRRPDATARIVDDAVLGRDTRMEAELLGLRGLDIAASAGLVVVKGTEPTADKPQLDRLSLWFDGHWGERAVLYSEVEFRDASVLPIALDAVWAGPDPNVVVHGRTYFVGSELPDGSTLQQVTTHNIALRHDGQTVILAY